MKNDIRFYFESKNGYMMPIFIQNQYRPEQLIEKYKLTYIKYEWAEWVFYQIVKTQNLLVTHLTKFKREIFVVTNSITLKDTKNCLKNFVEQEALSLRNEKYNGWLSWKL